MKRKKPTAADRPQFRRDLARDLQKLGVEIGEVGSDTMVICSRAEDFDPASNVLWELEANRSAVRPGVKCFKCGSVMAMSNHAYNGYARLDKKPRVCCVQCALTLEKP